MEGTSEIHGGAADGDPRYSRLATTEARKTLDDGKMPRSLMKKPANAFVLRQSPSFVNRLEEISLPQNVIINGWSRAKGLIEEKDWWRFREILRKEYYKGEKNLRKPGYAASTMQRFINGMDEGDWVVVPHWGGVFYVAEITGPAYYDKSPKALATDSAYRRRVRWLNGGRPIPRSLARAKLVSRMKTQQTSAEAGDLLEDIWDAVNAAAKQRGKGEAADTEVLLATSLRDKMTKAVLEELHHGYMTPQKMEKFVGKVLKAIGATEVKHIGTSKDKGVDLIATFLIGGITQVDVGVQVKCHEGETRNQLLDQLVTGLEKEDLSQGWYVTAARFQDDAEAYLAKKLEGTGTRISLVDGEQLARLMIDNGLQNIL